MPANCSICNSTCEDGSNHVKCVVCSSAMCHLNCVPLKTRSAKKDWVCGSCKPDRETPSLPDSVSTPSTSISKEFLVRTLESFKREMMDEFKKSTSENSELRTSLSFLSDAVDKNNTIMSNVMESLKKTEEENNKLRRENSELRSVVSSLEVRMRNLEQYSRKQNIEIDGVPETQGEDITTILGDVGKAIGVELKKEKIVAAHRIPSYNKRRISPIIVKFAAYEERDAWIAGFKNVRPLTANQINPGFRSSTKVFVNEHLSPENKIILSRTKEAAKEKGYKYVWNRDGKIFVRKNDGEKCKKIDSILDLNTL